MTQHSWASDQAIASLSKELIGLELAEQVAKRLIKDEGKSGLWFSHRDYCGHGLIYQEGQYCLIEVHDGIAEYSHTIEAWSALAEFCDWLEKQSDYTLSGADKSHPELFTNSKFARNNQRLTK